MRVVRGAAHLLGELMITLGVVLLLFVAWQLWWTDLAAGRTQAQLSRRLEQQWQAPPKGRGPSSTTSSTPGTPAAAPKAVGEGTAFAIIRIPRFGADYARPIIEGVGLEDLDRGVGHYPGAAQPGQIGNFAVAGHRVTYAKPFNRIAELQPGDPIVVETATTWYVYRVQRHVIVTPDHVEVVDPVPEQPGVRPTAAMMTMTACHPEFSARQRYVLFSVLDQTMPKKPGVVPDVLT